MKKLKFIEKGKTNIPFVAFADNIITEEEAKEVLGGTFCRKFTSCGLFKDSICVDGYFSQCEVLQCAERYSF